MSELAGLHAALSSEGVQLLRSPAQQSPAQQLWSQHQQQYQQPQQQQAQSPLRSGLQQHRQHIGSKQQPGQAGIVLSHETPTSAQLGEVGDALSAISSRLQNMQRSKAQQQAPGAPLLSGQATGKQRLLRMTSPSCLPCCVIFRVAKPCVRPACVLTQA